jgi:CRISPR-associated protein Csc2
MDEATKAIQSLLNDEFIVHTDFIGENFTPLLAEVKNLTGSEEGITSILRKADDEAKVYFTKHIKKASKEEKATTK